MPTIDEEQQLQIEPDEHAPALARRFVRSRSSLWIDDDRAAVAELLASELVTNATLHAHTAMTVIVRRLAGLDRIRVDVIDGSLEFPFARTTAKPGWGLQIVQSCATRWGCDLRADGKAVWFEI